eukprot:10784988-Alexandrium_andersonii.AAC.1
MAHRGAPWSGGRTSGIWRSRLPPAAVGDPAPGAAERGPRPPVPGFVGSPLFAGAIERGAQDAARQACRLSGV